MQFSDVGKHYGTKVSHLIPKVMYIRDMYTVLSGGMVDEW
jgi:hypothetical protein